MKVAVDLTFFTGTRGGMETYVRDLYRGLAQLHPEARYVAITTRANRSVVSGWFDGETATTSVGSASSSGWATAELLGVDRVVRRIRPDVLHCPANLAPARCHAQVVLTLHDVNAFSRSSGGIGDRVTRTLIRGSVRTARSIITDSRWSADEIERFLPGAAAPVTVIPPIGPRLAIEPRAPAFLAARRDNRPLALAGGNRLPHKNWEVLLGAQALIPPRERPLLVVTGGGRGDPLRRLVDELGLADDVVLPGWTTAPELEWLYRRANLFVLPSRYEGFGLGVLEAMARGCPVLASDLSVLREVGADAARYVDTTDPGAVAGAIRAMLADPAACDMMRRRGAARSLEFDPTACMEHVWTVLSEAAAMGSTR